MTQLNSQHNRIVWCDVPVVDLDRAAKFYRAVLAKQVEKQTFGDFTFCIIEHSEGNGGCLVLNKQEIAPGGGLLVYFNVNGRIRAAEAAVTENGGKVITPTHAIGPHGFRAVVSDSEGNRIALHSETDG